MGHFRPVLGGLAAIGIFAILGCGAAAPPKGEGNAVPSSGVDFGIETVGSTKTVASQVLITNTGTGSLSITGVAITGADATDFSLLTAPSSLPPDGTFTGTLQFAPAAKGQRQATLEITTDANATPTVGVPLTGGGA